MPEPQKPPTRATGSAWASAAEFGYSLLAGTLFLGGGGLYLDRKLGHEVPLFAIIGGSLAVATSLYMLVKRVIRESDKEMAALKGKWPNDDEPKDGPKA